MSRITRESAIKEVGADTVKAVESSHAVFTGRLTDGTADQGMTELAANASNLTMYVFVDSQKIKEVEDLSDLDWVSIISETAEYEVN